MNNVVRKAMTRKKGIVARERADVNTGSWRMKRPVVDKKKCIGCGICVNYCPAGVIREGKPVMIDYNYCKGCGICITVCPKQAIKIEEEGCGNG